MCTCFSRSFDKTEVILVCNWLDLFYPQNLEAEPLWLFLSSDGKTFFSMHKLKTCVSESIMYGNDNFSSWVLIPSRPDDFLFSSLDMYLPSSETERYGMTNGSCPLCFCLQKSCGGFDIHIHLFLVLLMILTQTGNDY